MLCLLSDESIQCSGCACCEVGLVVSMGVCWWLGLNCLVLLFVQNNFKFDLQSISFYCEMNFIVIGTYMKCVIIVPGFNYDCWRSE